MPLSKTFPCAFDKGFSTITGETGAGKSIFLGGLSLVLGKRADLNSLRDKALKCIIEAEFSIEHYGLKALFEAYDLDYDLRTILRREIHPNGKSRAFVNDSPVTLDVMSQVGQRLIDIHSQHQTLELTENEFQLKVIDALANNKQLLTGYKEHLKIFEAAQKELNQLKESLADAEKEQDYNSFLFNELKSAPLQKGILEELESSYEELTNVERILEQLSNGHQLLTNEEIGAQALLSQCKQSISKLSGYGTTYASLFERIQSVFVELDDITSEIESLQEKVSPNPGLLEEVNEKLQLLYSLQKKHSAATVEELLLVRDQLALKLSKSEDLEQHIETQEALIKTTQKEMTTVAAELSTVELPLYPN